MQRNFQGTDRGKRVVTTGGSAVGTIVRVDGERARVLLDPERVDSERVDPTGDEGDRSMLTIDRRAVDHSTNEVVRLDADEDPTSERRIA
ncbi:hypothetical protein ACFQMA_04250 [Halosimplex aquaticum]|uniref:DUF2171 domain-containing protein n=1 Tax=Halosimplex aquaticum TaxID=3026162 RepID=A0ABD5XV90_9EURY|nr:hypothetical protein [Halosimplex aquaticum]